MIGKKFTVSGILCKFINAINVFIKKTKRNITFTTQYSSYFPSLMTMINTNMIWSYISQIYSATLTFIVLISNHLISLIKCNAIESPKIIILTPIRMGISVFLTILSYLITIFGSIRFIISFFVCSRHGNILPNLV